MRGQSKEKTQPRSIPKRVLCFAFFPALPETLCGNSHRANEAANTQHVSWVRTSHLKLSQQLN